MGFTNRFRGITHLGSSVMGAMGMIYRGTTVGLVARAGGGQASATPLVSAVNKVSTVATAGDSVALKTYPQGFTGAVQAVINAGAAALSVYPPVGGTINGGAANAPFSVPVGKTCNFHNTDGLNWWANLSA